MKKYLGVGVVIIFVATLNAWAKLPVIAPERWVEVSGEITQGSAGKIVKSLLDLDAKPDPSPIGVRISSPGGSLFAVLAVCDVIKNLKHEVITVGIGQIVSGGVLILSSGSKRYISKHSMVMLHQPSLAIRDWEPSFSEFQEFGQTLTKIENQMYSVLAENTGKTTAEIKEEFRKEKWFTAEEAIANGLADELLESAK
jgi:ATP-dependent Clp protease protease subunit